MKETNVTKTQTTTKPATNLPESNPKLDTSSQTPIEIALKIDENGMTTASNLYAFLELEPKNFSHWCLRNIKKNKFAIEDEDYIVFVLNNENPKIEVEHSQITRLHLILQRNYLRMATQNAMNKQDNISLYVNND